MNKIICVSYLIVFLLFNGGCVSKNDVDNSKSKEIEIQREPSINEINPFVKNTIYRKTGGKYGLRDSKMYLIDHDYTPAKVWEIKNFELEKKNDCFIYSTLLEPESRHKIKSSNFYEIRYPDYPFDHIKIAYFETNKGEIQILQRGDHDFNFYIKSNNVEIHDKEKFDLGNKTMEFIIPGYD